MSHFFKPKTLVPWSLEVLFAYQLGRSGQPGHSLREVFPMY